MQLFNSVGEVAWPTHSVLRSALRAVEVELLRGGSVTVYVYTNRPFARLAQYEAAEDFAATGAGGWASCQTSSTATTTTATTSMTTTATTLTTVLPLPPPAAPPRANCDPSSPTVCIAPPPPDLDCKDVPHKNSESSNQTRTASTATGMATGCES